MLWRVGLKWNLDNLGMWVTWEGRRVGAGEDEDKEIEGQEDDCRGQQGLVLLDITTGTTTELWRLLCLWFFSPWRSIFPENKTIEINKICSLILFYSFIQKISSYIYLWLWYVWVVPHWGTEGLRHHALTVPPASYLGMVNLWFLR